jgi:hypothetical protein
MIKHTVVDPNSSLLPGMNDYMLSGLDISTLLWVSHILLYHMFGLKSNERSQINGLDEFLEGL